MPVYMIATLKIKYGQFERFNAVMSKLVPLVESEGWKLLGSYQPVIGDLRKVVDVWELPDANAVGAGLVAAAAAPGFEDVFAEVCAVVEDETLEIFAKTPFSP